MEQNTEAKAAPAVEAAPGKKGKRAKAPAKKAAKGRKSKPAARAKATEPKPGSNKAEAIRMLGRANGATLDELMEKFGWLSHTTRGFISNLGRVDKLKVESFKTEKGVRTYRIK